MKLVATVTEGGDNDMAYLFMKRVVGGDGDERSEIWVYNFVIYEIVGDEEVFSFPAKWNDEVGPKLISEISDENVIQSDVTQDEEVNHENGPIENEGLEENKGAGTKQTQKMLLVESLLPLNNLSPFKKLSKMYI
ncbi:hypothetical protein E3N88_23048 [Mikania micrantha]|uniref:Uncharacterized protein n=1 Tax=Mikania micrantha TaxID=192012 RepID=A0A5N6NDW7_9ASTR|nr:hypothetical protein E3N88_23048 [Mikania micrantha]